MSAGSVFSPAEMQMVTFTLGGESFGLDIMNVQEVIRIPAITRIPQAPNYVEGVANLSGCILPVIDTRTKLGMERMALDSSNRVIVVDVQGKTVGLNVDAVSEVLSVKSQNIEAAPSSLSQGIDSSSISGVVKIKDGKKLVMILDIASLCKIDQSALEERQFLSNKRSSKIKDRASVEEVKIIAFLLGKEEFGLKIEQVKEIIRYPDIVKVPNVPEYIKGIISLRDKLMPVVDLRARMDTGENGITDTTRVIVVDANGSLIGLTVDHVYEVINIPENTISPPPQAIVSDAGEKITGIARLDSGKRIIILMDLFNIVRSQAVDELSKQNGMVKEDLESNGILQKDMEEEQMVVFKLLDEHFGVQISQVQEITRLSTITKVPQAPKYVEGFVNLRGIVIPVIDLGKRFKLDFREYNQFTRIIVTDIKKRKVGLIVDEVLEVLRVSKHCIESAPNIIQDPQIHRLLAGIANVSERMIMMLNLENIMQASEWQKLAELSQNDSDQIKPGEKLKKQNQRQ